MTETHPYLSFTAKIEIIHQFITLLSAWLSLANPSWLLIVVMHALKYTACFLIKEKHVCDIKNDVFLPVDLGLPECQF